MQKHTLFKDVAEPICVCFTAVAFAAALIHYLPYNHLVMEASVPGGPYLFELALGAWEKDGYSIFAIAAAFGIALSFELSIAKRSPRFIEFLRFMLVAYAAYRLVLWFMVYASLIGWLVFHPPHGMNAWVK